MKMDCTYIMAVRLENRNESAVTVQKILTEYGCCIRTRLGLHDYDEAGVCSPAGILILQLCCGGEKSQELEKALGAVDGVKAKLVDLA